MDLEKVDIELIEASAKHFVVSSGASSPAQGTHIILMDGFIGTINLQQE